MVNGYLLAVAGIVIALTVIVWSGLWRLYRWLFARDSGLEESDRLILERQILAMALYFPVHLAAIVMPLDDRIRGWGSIFAAFVLALIGISAVRRRLFVAFNRQSFRDRASVQEGLAVAAGWLMLALALVVLIIGMMLINR